MAVRKLTQEEITRYGLASNDNSDVVKEINESVVEEVINEAISLLAEINATDTDDSSKQVEAPVLAQNPIKSSSGNKPGTYKKNRK